MAVLFNGGTTFNDSSGVAGPGEYIPALTSLTNGVNQHGKFVEFTSAGTSHHIDWPRTPWMPTGPITVSLLYEKTDATNRNTVAWGIDKQLASVTYQCHATMPFGDGTVYFEYGGNGGANEVSVGGLTFGADHWAFTVGARGMEIWQNGFLRASNGNTPTRTNDPTHPFKLGANLSGTGFVADLARINVCCVWDRQLDTRELWTLNTDPYAPWRNPV